MIEALAVIGWTLAAWLGWKLSNVQTAKTSWQYWRDEAMRMQGDLLDKIDELDAIRADTPARGANGRFVKRGT